MMNKYFDKYFRFSEFDSPDAPGSGEIHMDKDFLNQLATARHYAKRPFVINSGYRTENHNKTLRSFGYMVSPLSSHMKGLAADIQVINDMERHRILAALLKAGFRRIGIGKYFIHVDADTTKNQDLIWTYYKI